MNLEIVSNVLFALAIYALLRLLIEDGINRYYNRKYEKVLNAAIAKLTETEDDDICGADCNICASQGKLGSTYVTIDAYNESRKKTTPKKKPVKKVAKKAVAKKKTVKKAAPKRK